ncbi:MAG TPA: gamma-glutamylcyclotransferase [Pseudonocardiaceae bacterium]|nr:gamma-glutamylcyclotransferase [Pseudonocardiaceae bacterium]
MPFLDAAFPADPYPGTRPDHSFVHEGGTGHALLAGPPWCWSVAGVELDDWLAERDAEPLAARSPVLAYGSNANPAKISWLRHALGLTGPVVVLRVRCTGLAAVWATHLRVRDGQRPATLAAEPGRVEWHAVWLATRDQLRVLDVCEGRGERYRLVRLGSGTVTTEDGTELDGVLAYTAAGDLRAPLLVRGSPVRCADVPQAEAVSLVGQQGHDGLTVDPVMGEPAAEDWPDRLFVYGTLRPDGIAWHRIAHHVVDTPVRTTLPGTLYDTGLGFPALLREAGEVPGWTLRLRSPADALPALDAYEGAGYRRIRVVDSTGRLCWTYQWTDPVDGFVRLTGGWPDQA